MKTIKASQAKPGQWVRFTNWRFDYRIVYVEQTHLGDVRICHDFGNGGEPVTSFYKSDDLLLVS